MDNMKETVIDFYQGFEGEPEIQFISSLNGDKSILRIWDGYFDRIMDLIEPESDGWHGLAYYYNLNEGWYDTSPWEIPDINEAYQQLSAIHVSSLGKDEVEVLNAILSILNGALRHKEPVWIVYD